MFGSSNRETASGIANQETDVFVGIGIILKPNPPRYMVERGAKTVTNVFNQQWNVIRYGFATLDVNDAVLLAVLGYGRLA